MIKPYLTGIVALLFLLAVTAACVQTPFTPGPDTSRDEIHYKIYGGFIAPPYAVQELVVTQDKATFTIMSADGNITEKFEKPLTKDQFTAIVNVFTDNNFTSFGDRYDEGQNHITDVGFADITLIEGNRNKTVTTYNTNNYMPAGLVLIRQKLQETVTYVRSPAESSTISLTYQPMQCDKTVWDTWEANSGRVYIRAPTEEEIIKSYYISVYNIEVNNVTKVNSGMMACQACSVCPVTYNFGLTVNASEMQALVDEGWVRG